MSRLMSIAFDLISQGTGFILKWATLRLLLPFLQRIAPHTKWTHKRELSARLQAMPFIYKDLSADLLTDFVSVKIGDLDLTSMRSTQTNPFDYAEHRHKGLFVGNAGAGKTTFFSYTILSLFRGKNHPLPFLTKKAFLPFLVPLKVVSNTSPSPIVTYLLDSYKLLSGPAGISRLAKLAGRNQIFLFLDGYDEIQIPAPD